MAHAMTIFFFGGGAHFIVFPGRQKSYSCAAVINNAAISQRVLRLVNGIGVVTVHRVSTALTTVFTGNVERFWCTLCIHGAINLHQLYVADCWHCFGCRANLYLVV